MTKLPSWLSAGEVIAWIAFRKVPPTADWEDPSKPPAVVWEHLLPETHDWRAPRNLLLAALEARAAGEEWHAPPGEWWTTEAVLAEIARLEPETGKGAAELAASLRADIERIAAAEARIEQARADLRDAVSKGRITAYGRRMGAEENAAIPALKLSRRDREITEAGNIIAGAGVPEWTDVQFSREEVLAIWPEGREPATGAAPAATAWMLAEAKRLRAKGQRPKRDVIVKDCMRETHCSWDEALAAWKELPDDLRRRRGETNRAIARRRRAAAG